MRLAREDVDGCPLKGVGSECDLFPELLLKRCETREEQVSMAEWLAEAMGRVAARVGASCRSQWAFME